MFKFISRTAALLLIITALAQGSPVDLQTYGSSSGICSLPRNSDPIKSCLALIPQWTFDQTQGKCIQYFYGGCGATANSFDSAEECEAVCPSTAPKPIEPKGFCSGPAFINEGPIICALFNQGYTFNEQMGNCEYIEFSGCGATDNFYSTLQECEAKCGRIIY